jgi:diphosphomevalonate decarboxylase
MPFTAISTPNIAFIKYWGNRNNELRLPAADSLSMTLDRPSVEIDVEPSEAFSVRSFEADGREKKLTDKSIARFKETIDTIREYLDTLEAREALPRHVAITVRSHIPPSVGLASSAAVFSCLARALAGLLSDQIRLTDEQISIMARLGSGSAARSVFGGYAALRAGEDEHIDAAAGVQIADEHHWTLRDIIVIPSTLEKKIGSTEGHALAHTSPLFAERLKAIRERRQRECIDAILRKDFEKLQHVTEEDAIDMHAVMESSTPPLHYLTEDTHRILREITQLRESDHLPVLYTMDAGPTVHLVCEESAYASVSDFAHAQEQHGCLIFEAKTGPGARLHS